MDFNAKNSTTFENLEVVFVGNLVRSKLSPKSGSSGPCGLGLVHLIYLFPQRVGLIIQ